MRRRRPLASRTPALAAGWGAIVLLAASCGEPPAMEVGRVGYSEEELGALGPSQRTQLAQLTALGLAVVDERVDDLIEPFVRRDLRSILLQKLAMEVAVEAAGVNDEALRAAYARNPEHELVVQHLVVISERWRPPEHRDSARAAAVAALDSIEAGMSFDTAAARFSDEPGAAERGGRLDPGRRGSWVPEFWDAASALDEGAVSGVVETEYGFHVIRLIERRRLPLDAVRDQVLGRFVDLPEALGRAGEWAADRASGMRVDTAAVVDWAAGGDPAAPLVTWPDTAGLEPYRAADLRDYTATLRPEALAAVRGGDTAAAVSFVTGAARNEVMVRRARRLGMDASPAQQAALRRRWEDRVQRWATALGLARAGSAREVKAAALQALGAQQQEAIIARSEVPALAGVLERMYPVRVTEPVE